MKGFIKNVPGFRTNTTWKKIVAIVLYLFLFIISKEMLFSNYNKENSFYDNTILLITNFISILIILVLPYILITNLFNIRNKLPLYNQKSIFKNILGIFLTICFIFISLGVVLTIEEKLHKKEFLKRKELAEEQDKKRKQIEELKKIEEDKAEEEKKKKELELKKLKEETRQKELDAKKAEEERKQKELEIKKAEEERKQKELEVKQLEEQEKQKQQSIKEAQNKKTEYVNNIINNSREYNYDDLLKSASGSLKGKYIYLVGNITYIKEETFLGNFLGTSLLIEDYNGNIISAYTEKSIPHRKGDFVEIYGKIDGYAKGINFFGGISEVPNVEILIIN